MQPDNFEFWIDLNLPPSLATWIITNHKMLAKSFVELGFLETSDADVYKQAVNHRNVIIITTKDIDFIYLQDDLKGKPRILHINTGNISNKELLRIFEDKFLEIFNGFLNPDKTIIEINRTT